MTSEMCKQGSNCIDLRVCHRYITIKVIFQFHDFLPQITCMFKPIVCSVEAIANLYALMKYLLQASKSFEVLRAWKLLKSFK